MALSIKNEEADRFARELCRITGETITVAVTVALRERLERVKKSAFKRDACEKILNAMPIAPDFIAKVSLYPTGAEGRQSPIGGGWKGAESFFGCPCKFDPKDFSA